MAKESVLETFYPGDVRGLREVLGAMDDSLSVGLAASPGLRVCLVRDEAEGLDRVVIEADGGRRVEVADDDDAGGD